MATVPVDNDLISVEEYLRTSYSPDREYVDGRVVERNFGEKEHSILQMFLAALFFVNRSAWGVEVFLELRTQVLEGRAFRVPDVLVERSGVEFEDILDKPPLIAIEILSPDYRLSRMQDKFDEYFAFGIEHIWVFDPQRRVVSRVDANGLHKVIEPVLTVEGTPIRVVLEEVWAELDRG
jgi:Uma2 family endonuclease